MSSRLKEEDIMIKGRGGRRQEEKDIERSKGRRKRSQGKEKGERT